ncbi:MAG: hypothetical protein RL029_694, partial [Actinomycetota bacterium]
ARAAGEELNKMMTMKNSSGDPLTRREADILRHLATGLPLKEIASNLNISKNTIKTHLRNLYRKLGAEDRKDAVEKGSLRLPSSVVEHPPCKRKVVSSILTGGSEKTVGSDFEPTVLFLPSMATRSEQRYSRSRNNQLTKSTVLD